MRSFRFFGRCLLPLTKPPLQQLWTCRHCQIVITRFASSGTIQTGDELQSASPLKRRRGRPRKDRTIESNVASTSTAPVSDPEASLPDPISLSSTTTTATVEDLESEMPLSPPASSLTTSQRSTQPLPLQELPSPFPSAALKSPKLSSLHARLALPSTLPLETFARTLVDPTADPNPNFNNHSLAVLGTDLLGYYTSEHLICNYPRIPMAVLFAAQWAYVGKATLSSIANDWGVEVAAEPGGEVDPGLLQFKRAAPGFDVQLLTPDDRIYTNRVGEKMEWRRGMSSRISYDDSVGDTVGEVDPATKPGVTTLDIASTEFVRAVFGAVYLHCGSTATHDLFKAHITSRHLDLSNLFTFSQPTRDLSRLCAREGFEAPIARVLAETGRLSRHSVFVVGVFSGRDKLGEGSGNSLNEARFKAAINALKGWYLYSPARGSVSLPSQKEGTGALTTKDWKGAIVDLGEVVA